MKEFNCNLNSISPHKIINKSNNSDLDNFFLILGLIFNDLKGIILFNDFLIKNYKKPVDGEISAHAGEYAGIQIHIFKLSSSLISEFLITLEKHKDVIKSIQFKFIENKLREEIRNKWNNVLEIALDNKKDSDSYLSKIARIRSNITYHYDHSGTELKKSFIKRFIDSPKDDSNKKAYYAIGETIETTRFFYCDAIIHQYMNEHFKIDTLDYYKETNRMTKDINEIIVNLLSSYLSYKQTKNK